MGRGCRGVEEGVIESGANFASYSIIAFIVTAFLGLCFVLILYSIAVVVYLAP